MFKFKKSMQIEYEPIFKFESFNPFTTVKSIVPEWYKKHPSLKKGTSKYKLPLNHTVKACGPFLDTLTLGYAVVTLLDLGVTLTPDPLITWKDPEIGLKVVETRPPGSIPEELIPNGFSNTEFVWWTNVALKVPKGYAMLCTHPLNREDLPFKTLSGIIDGGFPMQNGKLPFFIREGFEGIIPKGTPIMQIIPFKVDDWKSKLSSTLLKESIENERIGILYSKPRYKTKFWQKKFYL